MTTSPCAVRQTCAFQTLRHFCLFGAEAFGKGGVYRIDNKQVPYSGKPDRRRDGLVLSREVREDLRDKSWKTVLMQTIREDWDDR